MVIEVARQVVAALRRLQSFAWVVAQETVPELHLDWHVTLRRRLTQVHHRILIAIDQNFAAILWRRVFYLDQCALLAEVIKP